MGAQRALSGDVEKRGEALAQLGFHDSAQAAVELVALSNTVGGPFSQQSSERLRSMAAPLLCDLADSPDPDLALRQYFDLDRQLRRQPIFYRQLEQPSHRRRVTDLLGSSEFLSRAIVRYPELLGWLLHAADPQQMSARLGTETLLDEVRQRSQSHDADDFEGHLRTLNRVKLREQLRIGVLDLAGILDIEDLLAQLCDVAEVCLQRALELAYPSVQKRFGPELTGRLRRGFSILGMGRLGAGEMSYGSDLDLLFIYDDRDGQDLRQGAVRLAQRLIAMLTTALPEGALYSIDTRLRPSGNQGPLVSSAAGFVHYHRDKAMLWERQALLKARPVAGNLQLGHHVLTEIDPIRYPMHLPKGTAAEIGRIRRRMRTEIAQEDEHLADIKTGHGGLVSIEFSIQYLQLKYGYRYPELRQSNSLRALQALRSLGKLSERRTKRLTEAYKFLRILENRLRIVHDRPVGPVDVGEASMDRLARRMGYREPRAGAHLRRRLARTTQAVEKLYEQLVEREAKQ